ncbi:MAG: hypothetical protein IPG04_40100 [Polyangiaceae bacterium]|nr:hypothetical protein [Polyangiaceae bacterium]
MRQVALVVGRDLVPDLRVAVVLGERRLDLRIVGFFMLVTMPTTALDYDAEEVGSLGVNF